MKKVIKIGILVLFISLVTKPIGSQNNASKSAFIPGETLKYIAYFGLINAGTATLHIKDSVYLGENVFHAIAEAKTIGLANKLYKVRDIYESLFDTLSGLPYFSIRNIREGGYKYYNEVQFFHDENKLISKKSGEKDVPENILDMLSAFYYMRNAMFNKIKKVGDAVVLDTYFADEIFPLKMRYVGDEKVKTKMGKFIAMKFSPVVEPGRVFDSEDDVTIWISKDKNYIPLQIRIDLVIGSIKCDLIEYSGLKHELVQIK
ncbi:MAG: hypothetical protein A2W99_14140 [Bacteroidetes bacterium GWF2_33_16]|nr:MAG: hypothetical protein A2X00_06070 [Bacteroidetes bacterium GWE2_32_14]OFY04767.1 MAG: hypothetical protein A2W99_14140 [Bacteroidetes bacterium GWF2_33_16]